MKETTRTSRFVPSYLFFLAILSSRKVTTIDGFSLPIAKKKTITRCVRSLKYSSSLWQLQMINSPKHDESISNTSDESFESPVDSRNSRREFFHIASVGVAGALASASIFSSSQPAIAASPENNGITETTQAAPSSTSFDLANFESTTIAETITSPSPVDYNSILAKASKRALGGGKAGAAAAVVQVCSLMWLRTAMNYQYRYGGDLSSSLKILTSEGGIPRLYQGLPFALVQGPLTRFGDTAANVGILALLEAIPETSALPLPLKTACGSLTAGLWRIVLMPIDTSKTSMQVEGKDGLERLWGRVTMEKSVGPLYQGSLASAAATAVGHFPWFLTYNFMSGVLPEISMEDNLVQYLARNALLGFSSSFVSDCCSNSLRVIKTTKQTAALGSSGTSGNDISYKEALALILEKDGIKGLFGRGLQTRLLTNAIQGAAFTILWKYFQTVGASS